MKRRPPSRFIPVDSVDVQHNGKLVRVTVLVDVHQLVHQYVEKAYRNKKERVEQCKGGVWISVDKNFDIPLVPAGAAKLVKA
jgi:hypothetical protein